MIIKSLLVVLIFLTLSGCKRNKHFKPVGDDFERIDTRDLIPSNNNNNK